MKLWNNIGFAGGDESIGVGFLKKGIYGIPPKFKGRRLEDWLMVRQKKQSPTPPSTAALTPFILGRNNVFCTNPPPPPFHESQQHKFIDVIAKFSFIISHLPLFFSKEQTRSDWLIAKSKVWFFEISNYNCLHD